MTGVGQNDSPYHIVTMVIGTISPCKCHELVKITGMNTKTPRPAIRKVIPGLLLPAAGGYMVRGCFNL